MTDALERAQGSWLINNVCNKRFSLDHHPLSRNFEQEHNANKSVQTTCITCGKFSAMIDGRRRNCSESDPSTRVVTRITRHLETAAFTPTERVSAQLPLFLKVLVLFLCLWVSWTVMVVVTEQLWDAPRVLLQRSSGNLNEHLSYSTTHYEWIRNCFAFTDLSLIW